MDMIVPPANLAAELDTTDTEIQSQDGIKSCNVESSNLNSSEDANKMETEDVEENVCPKENDKNQETEPKSSNEETEETINSVENTSSVEDNRTIDDSVNVTPTDDQSNTKSTIDSVDHISNSVSENNQVCETTEIPQQAEIEKSIEENLHSPNPLDTEVTTNETVSEDKPIEIGEISNKELKAQPVEEPMEVDSEIHDSLSEKEEEALPVAEIIPTEPKKYLHEDNISTNDTNEVEKDTNETEENVNKLNNTENTSDRSQNNEIMNIEENSLSMETENVSEKCEENETLKIDTLKNDPFESLKSGFTDNESTDISKTHSSSEISMSIDLEKEKVPSAETSTEDLPDSEDMQQTNDVLSETEDQDIEQENPVFVHVNTKGDGESEGDKTLSSDVDQSDAGDESLEASCLTEEDPIGITQEAEKDELMDYTEDTTEKEQLKVVDINEAITSDKSSIDDELTASKGADEELCIIPDTEREISQEEKDAARAAAAAAAEAAEKTLADAAPTETTETVKDVEESEKSETAASSSDSKDVEKSGDKLADNVTDEKTTSNEIDATSQDTDVNNENSEVLKRPNDIKITEIPESEQTEETCQQCCNQRKSVFRVESQEKPIYLCSQTCVVSFRTLNKSIPEQVKPKSGIQLKDIAKTMAGTPSTPETNKMYVRKCSECSLPINASEEKVLSWETMDFCNEDCLSKYQNTIGSHCANCKNEVLMSSLGKYCVRFGHDIRQFCCSSCLEEFKKGLKVCSYCQKDISGGQEGFLAPVGDKGQFKDFCTQLCMDKYEQMSNKNSVKKTSPELALCFVCNEDKPVNLMFEQFELKNKFCGEPCFIAYKYVNNVDPLQCEMCKNYFENENSTKFSIFYDNMVKNFCSKTCQNIYIIANRRIVPCSWCKVKKYNFDMIRKVCSNGQVLMMCSLNCLSLFQVSISAVSTKRMKCDHCAKISQAQYHLTMSDATIRNFCAYPCVMAFQNQFSKVPITLNTPAPAVSSDKPSTIINTRSNAVPAGGPKRYSNRTTRSVSNDTSEVQMPVITNVQSLASPVTNGPTQSATVTRSTAHKINNQQQSTPQPPSQPVVNYKQHVIVKAPPMPEMKNAVTLCKPLMHTKGVSCRPHPCSKETQTDEIKEKTVLVPVPVPIYVPAPAQMYSAPVPVPIPFPIPIPVPIFIPTTRNSAAGIMKEIKKIQVKIPTDPFEAELLMMAEMVAGEKKVDNTDSESEEDDTADTGNDGGFSPEAVDTSNTFGDDMLQMALKMATELDEPAVDLEGALTANTITASQNQDQTGVVQNEEAVDDPQPMHQLMDRGQPMRGRKRPNRQPRNMNAAKRGRRMSQHVEMPLLPPPPPQQPPEPIEKPDANMCLKYTFGVNAWKQWVTTKNAELEKSSRRVKLFKNEILQLTADELNYSLCLFVKEVRKPNGTEYAPDTIYYLCLGIQQYLFENGRIDNIFTDAYYEKFTDCLDEVARKFSVLYNDSHYIVTRVEEEHLWESKQLGAHSPHVLLSTLMFFNTKHFNLTTVDEHMQLSFSHIMKHWKRNPNQPGAAKIPGSRNVLLRFYPPQTTLDSNSRKKKVYEQQENEENPLRCPVKLYEFYLSKCPESVKTRNDVFYLLPERSCVPDSPVWYSTMALGREALEKMLHRVKMVKEINVALLTMD